MGSADSVFENEWVWAGQASATAQPRQTSTAYDAMRTLTEEREKMCCRQATSAKWLVGMSRVVA